MPTRQSAHRSLCVAASVPASVILLAPAAQAESVSTPINSGCLGYIAPPSITPVLPCDGIDRIIAEAANTVPHVGESVQALENGTWTTVTTVGYARLVTLSVPVSMPAG